MTARKPFLLRVEPGLLVALERWAADDLRSVNGQIEFLLRDALRRAGRTIKADPPPAEVTADLAAPAAVPEAVDDEPPAHAATGGRRPRRS